MEQVEQRRVPEAVAANRWLQEVYEPTMEAIPPHLRSRLDAAEIFHEIMEHRWFMSEAAGRDVGTSAATEDYIRTVLPEVPDDLVTPAPDTAGDSAGDTFAVAAGGDVE
jgi:hypothetical protein